MADVEQFIQLKKDNILRIGIKDQEGKDTGERIEFDLEDTGLLLRLNEVEEMHKKNVAYVRGQVIAIDKKQDHLGKKMLSYNTEAKIKLFNEFYKREMEALDLFLGKGGTQKLLNGRNPYLSMYDDIQDMLEPIMPLIEQRATSIADKIKLKYSTKKGDVLK